MKFQSGQSGNPSGKKPGTLNKRTQLAKLFEAHAPELINKCIELALAGDTNALRLAIERLTPRVKDEPLIINLPPEKITPALISQLAEDVIRMMSNGNITPEQAKSIFEVIKSYRENLPLEELLAQIKSLQETLLELKSQSLRKYQNDK